MCRCFYEQCFKDINYSYRKPNETKTACYYLNNKALTKTTFLIRHTLESIIQFFERFDNREPRISISEAHKVTIVPAEC